MRIEGTSRTSIARPAFVPPKLRSEWVERRAILDRLTAASEACVVLVDAPVGYGKTTLLAQWAQHDTDKTFVWLSLEPADSDPVRLLTSLLRSLKAAGLAIGLPDPISPGLPAATATIHEILEEIGGRSDYVVFVLDDYHVLRGDEVHQVVARLVAECPANSQLALGTRADPPFELARLRASGQLCEVRATDLEFDTTTAAVFFENMQIELDNVQVDTLVDRAEGWPAGLYLAALSLREESQPQGFLDRFAGSHRNIADYLAEEVFARQPHAMRRFLTHTAVLGRLSGPLCDAVLGTEGSQQTLELLERSNLFVVALDDTRDWFRYHHLFGQMLQAELARTNPTIRDELHSRASQWFEGEGLYDEAINHAIAGHDVKRASAMISDHWLTLFNQGRIHTVRGWLTHLGPDAIETDAAAALTAGWAAALAGEPEQMEYFLDLAEKLAQTGSADQSIDARVSLVRGLFGFAGLQARRSHLCQARALEPTDSVWQPFISWGLGHVALMAGDPAEAAAYFREIRLQPLSRQPVLAMITLAAHAVAELDQGDVLSAEHKATQAMEVAVDFGLLMDTRSSGVRLALGRVAAAQGELDAGRQWLEDALRMRRTGRLSPWPTLEVLLALAPVRFRLGADAEAYELVQEARSLIADLPDAGELPTWLGAVARQIMTSPFLELELEFGQQLTERELLVLRMCRSSSSQREIGDRLFLSVNTVKSHLRSVYRKLGVSSRGEALERAQNLGLL